MRDLRIFEEYKVQSYNLMSKYLVPHGSVQLEVVVSNALGWEHVSAQTLYKVNGRADTRIPSSEEMEAVKKMFYMENEVVVEIHPKRKDYVNQNSCVLHLWRNNRQQLPVPPHVSSFDEEDLVEMSKPNTHLIIKSSSCEGWRCYEVGVLKNGKPLRRKPNWNEMCIAKEAICGDDTVAFQYHLVNEETGDYSTRLWVAPRELEIPLPEPGMVGMRSIEDPLRLMMKLLLDPEEKKRFM